MGGRLVFWVLVAGAIAGGYFWRRRQIDVQDLVDQLNAALPSRLAQWAPQLAKAAAATSPAAVGDRKWGLILAGIMDRESRGGLALEPRGPAGVGDYGHGRGLMQIDDRAWPDFTAADAWQDPEQNIMFGDRLLRDYYDQVDGELLRAVAAYNRGPSAFDAKDPDLMTTGGNYGADVLARADAFDAASAGGEQVA